MSNALHIWLPLDMSLPWHWRQSGDYGLAINDADKAALSDRDGRELVVIIPGQIVRIFSHDLPKMREAERLAAAGFAIEDKIAVPLTGQHIVPAPLEDPRIAIIACENMKGIVKALSAAELQASALFADFDVLSDRKGPILLPDRCVYPGPLGHTQDPEWAKAEVDEESYAQVTKRAEVSRAVNLLSGEFAPKNQSFIGRFQLLRLAALFLVCGIVWLGLMSAQNRAAYKQAEYIRAETSRMYTQFTGQSAPSNPALTVTRAVKTSVNVSADFVGLSASFFDAIKRVDGVTIETLQFDESQNRLTLRLIYPRFESATDLERAVAATGAEFRAGGIREQGGKLIGDAVMSFGDGT